MARRRPYWSGTIRLSLVILPVQIYPASNPASAVRFHLIHKPSGERVRHQNVVPGVGAVADEDVVKGYEYEKHRYVLVEPEEVKEVRIESSDTLTIVQFVERQEIDAIYFSDPYYVVPDGDGAREAFAVIRDALKKTKRVGIGQIVFSGRERIVALQPCSGGMLLETLRYEDEVKKASGFFGDLAGIKSDPEQLELAETLIAKKQGAFDPSRFKDHYQDALRELVGAKLKGRKLKAPPSAGGGAQIIDLMEALKRSVKGGSEPARKRPAASTRAPRARARARGR